jgi:hypothetical protein
MESAPRRDSGGIKPVILEEILAWRHEGHRCWPSSKR